MHAIARGDLQRIAVTRRPHVDALPLRACDPLALALVQPRARLRDKRGGGQNVQSLDEGIDVPAQDDAQSLIAVDEALQALERSNPRWARVVECRFFAGYTDEETAQALDVPLRTVQRDWQQARQYLAEHWA